MASLRLVPPSGSPIEIEQDQVLVGRETTCDVVLNDGSVSRKHARLEKRGRLWMVVDQGSANGTFVDSQRIAETQLRTGQELRFGAVKFRVEIEGDEVIGATMLTEAADATMVQAAPSAVPSAAPPAPPAAPPARPPAPAPAPPPPPLPRAAAPVPPTGSLPPGSIPGRVAPPPPPRPATPGSRPPSRAAIPPVPAAAEGAPPRKGKGPLFWVATGCCGCLLLGVVLSALIGGFAFQMTADAVAAVRTQLADIKSGDLDAAYGRFTEDYRARVSREEFEVLVSRHPGLQDNADSTFWKRSVENARGEVSGMLTSTSGTKEMVTYRLVKEGGTWKISDIEFAGQTSS